VRSGVDPRPYHDWLSPLSQDLDVWVTTYVHALGGDDPIVDWTSGTSLRPYLEALGDPAERRPSWRRGASGWRSTIRAARTG
jgi:trans-aconitate 2-methyltransferase